MDPIVGGVAANTIFDIIKASVAAGTSFAAGSPEERALRSVVQTAFRQAIEALPQDFTRGERCRMLATLDRRLFTAGTPAWLVGSETPVALDRGLLSRLLELVTLPESVDAVMLGNLFAEQLSDALLAAAGQHGSALFERVAIGHLIELVNRSDRGEMSELRGVKRLVARLADRRALYVPTFLEYTPHVIESVQVIRVAVIEARGVATSSDLQNWLDTMTRACHEFLTAVGRRDGGRLLLPGGSDRQARETALRLFRQRFGAALVQLCNRYHLGIPSTLEDLFSN